MVDLRVNILDEASPYGVTLSPGGPPGPVGPTGPVGPPGPQGPPGTDQSRSYEQLVASTEWVIPHTLNKQPSVTTVDSLGRQINGQVYYDSPTQVRVTFIVANAGFAYLN